MNFVGERSENLLVESSKLERMFNEQMLCRP